MEQVRAALAATKGPNRQLDALVASTLLPEMIWRGRPLGTRHLTMAFTRGVENAERFVQIALPGWGWTIGSHTNGGGYYSWLFSPDGEQADEGDGATPALALLIAALTVGIEDGGWPAMLSPTQVKQRESEDA